MSTSSNASAFAWGAADAAGSVISSTADMATVLALLLGVDGSEQGEQETNDSRRHRSTSATTAARTGPPLSRTAWFDPTVVAGMLSGQMTVSWDWVKGCGLQPGGGNAPPFSSKGQTPSGGQTILGGQTTAGHAVAAGLGFDLVGDILLAGRRHPYV